MTTVEDLLQKLLSFFPGLKKFLQSISGHGPTGSRIYGVAEYTGLRLTAISIREEGTTFDYLTAEGSGPDLDLDYWYQDGTTPKAADLLTPPDGYHFTAFELTAGSVQGT